MKQVNDWRIENVANVFVTEERVSAARSKEIYFEVFRKGEVSNVFDGPEYRVEVTKRWPETCPDWSDRDLSGMLCNIGLRIIEALNVAPA